LPVPREPKFLAAPLLLLLLLSLPAAAQKKPCFTREARAAAERQAKVWQEPDPGYDPVLGYSSQKGPVKGALEVDEAGLGKPFKCVANKDPQPGSGTTPKFHCSVVGIMDEDGDLIRYKVKPHFKGQSKEKRNGEVYGEFLASRFSKALGFFADDEWVADVTCPDCEKSLTSSFQGARFEPFQPAAGIELNIGNGIDTNCDGKDSAPLGETLSRLLQNGAPRAEVDAFKLWLGFIDHGDTKTDNHKFACLKWAKNADGSLLCEEGQAVYYVSDMGSTFGHSSDSEKKARLAAWKGKDPMEGQGPDPRERWPLHGDREERGRHERQRGGPPTPGAGSSEAARRRGEGRPRHEGLPRLSQPGARPAGGGLDG
jgi:hypothetical protein